MALVRTMFGSLAVALVIGTALVLLTRSCAMAAPPPDADPAIAPWFKGLKTDSGGDCCGEADCRPVDSRVAGGHFEALYQGEWVAIPDDAVRPQPINPVGRAVLCMYQGNVRCFVPPIEVRRDTKQGGDAMTGRSLSFRLHNRRLRLVGNEKAVSMGDAFWSERKRVAELRMRDFDRHPAPVRDIANVTGFPESARYFKTPAEAERAIAEAALRELEQTFQAEDAAAQAEAAGITRKSRLRA